MNEKLKSNTDVKTVEWFDDRFYQIDYSKLSRGVQTKYNLPNEGIDFFPSVTTILGAAPKPWLSSWRGQVGNWEADKVINEAAEKGSRIHSAISVLVQGGDVYLFNPRKPAYNQVELNEQISASSNPWYILNNQQEMLEVFRFQSWLNEVSPSALASEITIFSLLHKFAGTLDLLLTIKAGKYNINGEKPIELPAGRFILDIKTGNEDDQNHPKQLAAYMQAYEEDSNDEIVGGLIVYTNAKTKSGLKTVFYSRETLLIEFERFLDVKKVFDHYSTIKPEMLTLPAKISWR